MSDHGNVPKTNPNPLRRDLPPSMVPESCTLLIFGATGDLAKRKIMPALFNLARQGFLPPGFTAICAARRPFTDQQIRNDMLDAVNQHSRHKPVTEQIWQDFAKCIFYQQLRFDQPSDFARLSQRVKELEDRRLTGQERIFYLATAPEFFTPIAEHLNAAGLNHPENNLTDNRIVVEKPFGQDLNSARRLNHKLQSVFDESQIYRIDHYLGKETVQNILALRFANTFFEPLWNRKFIDHVQISVAERDGMESRRGQYYDSAGALRDMMQNHMMQLLALTAMEPPLNTQGREIRNQKVKTLQAVKPLTKNEIADACVRGQYASGNYAGHEIKAYRTEQAVNPDSNTETYVALRLYIDNKRWAGVPFYLRTGKRLPKRTSEIAVRFKAPAMKLFGSDARYTSDSNQLVIRVQPEEGVSLSFGAKVPGMQMRIGDVKMDFQYGTSFGGEEPEAYERLLLDAMLGEATLFIRADEVEHSWKIIDPITQYWASQPPPKFPNYQAGTWGPIQADALIAKTQNRWRRL